MPEAVAETNAATVFVVFIHPHDIWLSRGQYIQVMRAVANSDGFSITDCDNNRSYMFGPGEVVRAVARPLTGNDRYRRENGMGIYF
jgi:hypothetical protein